MTISPEERGRRGGTATAAAGHVNTSPAREAFLAKFPDEESRRTYFSQLGRRPRRTADAQRRRGDAALLDRMRAFQRRRAIAIDGIDFDGVERMLQKAYGSKTRIRGDLR